VVAAVDLVRVSAGAGVRGASPDTSLVRHCSCHPTIPPGSGLYFPTERMNGLGPDIRFWSLWRALWMQRAKRGPARIQIISSGPSCRGALSRFGPCRGSRKTAVSP